jgi:hypothetical protein
MVINLHFNPIFTRLLFGGFIQDLCVKKKKLKPQLEGASGASVNLPPPPTDEEATIGCDLAPRQAANLGN